ncbi:MAG TPA: OadG family transporter subunit [Prolixibacteraceae bacterium]|jgi:Na+-transporting methylmalonyl-CoA/oxaloacetate decarboxylase gamma subunit|nr:OadG family transporter subunit [Prolixibacteraceae bacterium]HUM88706.1 OadG family transporter subunit [Prolixibacteraceae bacterium]
MHLKSKFLLSWFILTILIVSTIEPTNGQNASDLKFNEILVVNDSSNIDDFGMHSSWIEIFNSAHNTVDIGGCYLTDDLSNPTKYWIPAGDPITKIPSQCYILFWADNKPTRGIRHLNFELKGASVIALFDASGKNMIDKLEITTPQKADVSFGVINNETREWGFLDHITPASNNDYSKKASAGEEFVKMDPTGIGLAITSMAFVFLSLVILFIAFKFLGKMSSKSPKKPQKTESIEAKVVANTEELSGEVNAAIAMSLFLYHNELHDHENTVLTIQKVSRNYSPWSSKIYTLRKNPR